MAMHSQHVGLQQQQQQEEAPLPTGHLPYTPAMSYVLPTPVIALSSALPQNLFCPMPVQFGPMLPPQQPHQFLQPASGQFTLVGQAMPGYNVVLPTVTSHPSMPMQCSPRPGQVPPLAQAALAPPHEPLSSAVAQAAQAAKAFFLSTNQLRNPGGPMPYSAYAYQPGFGPPTAIQPCGTAPRQTIPLVAPSMQPGQQSPSASASLHLERAKKRAKATGKRTVHDWEKEEQQESPKERAKKRAKATGKRTVHDWEKEEEQQESPKVQMTPRWFFLERTPYSKTSADDDDIIWIAAETSEGVCFGVSLCTQEPPSISRLLLASDVANDAYTLYDRCYDSLSIRVISSSSKAILFQTVHEAELQLHHDYFVLECDLSCPVISRLPKVHHLTTSGMGLFYRDSYYLVAVLKKNHTELPTYINTSKKLDSVYPMVFKGPYISSFSTLTNEWKHRMVYFPLELKDWDWDTDLVFSCGGKFWWVDLRCGLLSCDCDPLLEQPTLNFTPLPNRSVQCTSKIGPNRVDLLKDCSISISNGLLRYVQICRLKACEHCGSKESVEMWTLHHGKWTKDYTLQFADLWENEKYCSMGLPKEVPTFPVVDPFDANVVYCSIKEPKSVDGRVFGVNLRTKNIKSCSSIYQNLHFCNHTIQPVFEVACQSPLIIDSTAASSSLYTPAPCIKFQGH